MTEQQQEAHREGQLAKKMTNYLSDELGRLELQPNSFVGANLSKLSETETKLRILRGRLSEFVDSGCRFPVGAFAKVNGNSLDLTVVAYSIDGKQALIVKKSGEKSKSYQIGKEAANELQQKGVNDLAKDWRAKLDEWNKT